MLATHLVYTKHQYKKGGQRQILRNRPLALVGGFVTIRV